MSKFIITIFCILFAMIPEMIMFGIYKLTSPVGFWQNFAVLGVMFWFGLGVSLLFLVIAFIAWLTLIGD